MICLSLGNRAEIYLLARLRVWRSQVIAAKQHTTESRSSNRAFLISKNTLIKKKIPCLNQSYSVSMYFYRNKLKAKICNSILLTTKLEIKFAVVNF